jgi:UDPglucose--hexose-1-phosphate uridylyltransferase
MPLATTRLGRRVLPKPDGRYLILYGPGQAGATPAASRWRPETPSELRWHPLLREWVTVAPWRQDRTYHPPTEACPLCPTRPGGPETEIPEPRYHIAVFENRFPSYSAEQGRCEVVCYTDRHDTSLGALPVEHVGDLVRVWQDRVRELSRPPIRQVYVFENRGQAIGVTLHHPHGQIYGYPFVPPLVQRELDASAEHARRHRECLYCRILADEVAGPRVVVRDRCWCAFVPAFARWPYEVHLAPLAHVGSLADLDDQHSNSLARRLKDLLQRYDRLFRRPLPYVMAVHQRPVGRGARHYHLHFEFYPPNRDRDRLKYLAGSELGAGAFTVDVRVEDSARELRRLG